MKVKLHGTMCGVHGTHYADSTPDLPEALALYLIESRQASAVVEGEDAEPGSEAETTEAGDSGETTVPFTKTKRKRS